MFVKTLQHALQLVITGEESMIEAKPTVLIVDGSKTILQIMTRILERNGYAVVTAETGSEAEKKLETHICDATLLGSEPSDMDLTMLLRKIREKAPNILKIVLTNSPLSEDTFDFDHGDVWAFLVKPVKPEILLNILGEKLRKK